jgi:poly(glycerol-phosphate) alpha-glucosyltransferase
MVSPHGMLDAWALGNSGWKKRLAAWAYEDANLRGAACLHALNTAEVEAIRDYGYDGPVCVIPNGVHLPEVAKPLPKPWWTKSAPDARTILYLGRLHPKKGLQTALTAWSQINPALRNDWRLVIAGWDENSHQTALRRRAAGLRIEDTVTFPGPLFSDDKRAAYQHCDGFILPSLSEGLPMAALEAWGAGKPLLMTPACNLPEGYEAGAAMRIEPDAEDIAAGMTNFMSLTDAEREAMGAKGLALVREKYSWPVIASEMAAVYRWVAANGSKPATVIEK